MERPHWFEQSCGCCPRPAVAFLCSALIFWLRTTTSFGAFADIADRDASKATSMSAVLQQMSLALGVAVAGTILEIETTMSGTPLSLEDFHLAFVIHGRDPGTHAGTLPTRSAAWISGPPERARQVTAWIPGSPLRPRMTSAPASPGRLRTSHLTHFRRGGPCVRTPHR